MNKNIPINKGNYDMEPPERIVEYERNRGFGWEAEYQRYRKNWAEFPQKHYVSEYPLQVDIELSSICNLHCPMCFTTTAEFQKKVNRTFMDMDLFYKIVDEISGKVPAVRLSLRGESTLHPAFVPCIEYCKKKGIKEVSFLTNASFLTKEYFIRISQAGADWITISLDGMGQVYESIRKPLKFNDTLEKIKDISKIKRERGWRRPVIKVQAIWPAIREDPSEYYNTFSPYVDMVAFNPLIDYLGNDEDIVYDTDFSCPQLYQRLIIGSDGNALLCTNDEKENFKLGNANKSSIYEIWHGALREKARELHLQGKFMEMDLCRKCYLPRATEENEYAFINQRRIVIKNYINRVQNIGE